MSNFNNFIAVSARVKLPNETKYFVGIVQDRTKGIKNIKYELKVIQKKELLFDYSLSLATLRRYKALLLANANYAKEYIKALRLCWQNKRVMETWIELMLQNNADKFGLPKDFAKFKPIYEIIIGKVK